MAIGEWQRPATPSAMRKALSAYTDDKSFGAWGEIFGGATAATAMVDRLIVNSRLTRT